MGFNKIKVHKAALEDGDHKRRSSSVVMDNPNSVDSAKDIWQAYLPHAYLSRILGVMPWSIGKDRVLRVKLLSWVTPYNIIVLALALHFQMCLVVRTRKARIASNNNYDMIFMEVSCIIHPICQIWFFIYGYLRIAGMPITQGLMQKIVDSLTEKEKENTLRMINRFSMVSTFLYSAYALIFSISVVIDDPGTWSSPSHGADIWVFYVMQVVRGFGSFYQLSYVTFGFCLIFDVKVLESAISSMISKINKTREAQMDIKRADESYQAECLNNTYTLLADFVEAVSCGIGNILVMQIFLTGLDILFSIYILFNGSLADIGVSTSSFHAIGASVYLAFICNSGTRLSVSWRSLLRVVLKKSKQRDLTPSEREQYMELKDHILNDPLKANAGNFCVIDRMLITAIIGAVSTYLIVLIQFKVAQS